MNDEMRMHQPRKQRQREKGEPAPGAIFIVAFIRHDVEPLVDWGEE